MWRRHPLMGDLSCFYMTVKSLRCRPVIYSQHSEYGVHQKRKIQYSYSTVLSGVHIIEYSQEGYSAWIRHFTLGIHIFISYKILIKKWIYILNTIFWQLILFPVFNVAYTFHCICLPFVHSLYHCIIPFFVERYEQVENYVQRVFLFYLIPVWRWSWSRGKHTMGLLKQMIQYSYSTVLSSCAGK